MKILTKPILTIFVYWIVLILLIYECGFVEGNFYRIKMCETAMQKTLAGILHQKEITEGISVTPFHSIIGHFENETEALQKLMMSCYSIFRYEKCLSICEDSKLKFVKLASIKHWKSICGYAREQKNDFLQFIKCEKTHMIKAKNKCQTSNGLLRNLTDLDGFCSSLKDYNKCYSSLQRNCTDVSLEISHELDKAVIDAYTSIVDIASDYFSVPKNCNWIVKEPTKLIEGKSIKEDTTIPKKSNPYARQRGSSIHIKEEENFTLSTAVSSNVMFKGGQFAEQMTKKRSKTTKAPITITTPTTITPAITTTEKWIELFDVDGEDGDVEEYSDAPSKYPYSEDLRESSGFMIIESPSLETTSIKVVTITNAGLDIYENQSEFQTSLPTPPSPQLTQQSLHHTNLKNQHQSSNLYGQSNIALKLSFPRMVVNLIFITLVLY